MTANKTSRDRQYVAERLQGIKRRVVSLRDEYYKTLDGQDDADLYECQAILERLLSRYTS